jgi:hypothetical protein
MIIPCITLWEPWASWIVLGWKTIETRNHSLFAVLEGKTIGIHAGRRWDRDAVTLAFPFLTKEQRVNMVEVAIRSAIIGTAKVIEHRRLTVTDSKRALIDCSSTLRYGLILDEIIRFDPIPVKGKQGIWYYDLPNIYNPYAGEKAE